MFVEVDVDMPQYLDEAEWVDGLAKARPPRARSRRLPAAGARGRNRTGDGKGRETQDDTRRTPPDPKSAGSRIRAEAGISRSAPAAAEIRSHLRHLHFSSSTAEHARDDAPMSRRRVRPRSHRQAGHQSGTDRSMARTDPQMAALPNVVCKLSGVTTEADHRAWTREQLRPYIDHVIECFGPDRVIYGSDWPVSELAGAYCDGCRCWTGLPRAFRRRKSASSSATTRSRPIDWTPDGRAELSARLQRRRIAAMARRIFRAWYSIWSMGPPAKKSRCETTRRPGRDRTGAHAACRRADPRSDGRIVRRQTAAPVIIGPTGLAGLLWPHAELATRARRPGSERSMHQSCLDLDDRGDRRGVAGAEMDAGLSLKDRGSPPNYRARRGGRVSGPGPDGR